MATQTFQLEITGMHCDGCVKRVRQKLGQLAGVEVRAVEVGRARVALGPDGPGVEAAIGAVKALGFAVDAARPVEG